MYDCQYSCESKCFSFLQSNYYNYYNYYYDTEEQERDTDIIRDHVDDCQCVYDYVEVFDGFVREKFCGSSIPGPFTSSGNSMVVTFHTDGSLTGRGFSAVWIEV